MKKYLHGTAIVLIMASGFDAGLAFANPEDGVVFGGSATITQSGKKMDIHQNSDRLIIDWRSFDIAPDEHTQFHQPNHSATALNRIGSGNPSQILGKLSANGNLIIINPGGILFGKDSQVDVNGLVATTSDIEDNDFMSGNMNFHAAGNSGAAVINKGKITAAEAGLVGLVAPDVTNSGTISARLGKVQIASGDSFTADLYGDGLINVAISDSSMRQMIANTGAIHADGGRIEISAATGAGLVNSLIDIGGELKAASVSENKGVISIKGDVVSLTGDIDVSGTSAGQVDIQSRNVAQQGRIFSKNSGGSAGKVSIKFSEAYLDNQNSRVDVSGAGGQAGAIRITGTEDGSRAFISGEYDASSSTHKGGDIEITAKNGDLKLFGASIHADGKAGGGKVKIGGDYQGTGTVSHAKTTHVNFGTHISANATSVGDGGTAIVWSDKETLFGGHIFAKGGALGGNGGLIEISSKDTMKIAGNSQTDASALNGIAGEVLLDPKNIIIATGGILGGGISSIEFIDPNADAGRFGYSTILMSNGNVFIFDDRDDFSGVNAGAIYLFNGTTGALISTLVGSSAGDTIGTDGVGATTYMALANGNIVFSSEFWDNGGAADAGAMTWASATTGVSGVVGGANSLIGSSAADMASAYVTPLSNGNYVVTSRYWDNGGATDAGAATWGSGTTGVSGPIDATNSLVGSTTNDLVGVILPLVGNGNYIVLNYFWDNLAIAGAGAVTWADGTVGVSGVIDATNSLVGSSLNDNIGVMALALSNGNAVISSPEWDNGGVNNQAGAVTWINGLTGLTGTIDATNSLVGTSISDRIGGSTVELSNGNYITSSGSWSNGGATPNAGAVTWGNGTTGTVGIVSAANSLIGGQANDYVGGFGGFDILSNGNYVVRSPDWNSGGTANVGAITWGDGTVGVAGVVSIANSLIGSSANDRLGDYNIINLSNGNYVIRAPDWDDGGNVDAGAAIWADGSAPITGTINAANAYIGDVAGQRISSDYVVALDNGNYLVITSGWDDGLTMDVGAVTWGDGLNGSVGVVDGTNSLIGSTAGDQVGSDNVYTLANGNYIVISSRWDDGLNVDTGAITWGNGATGTTGAITVANSFLGSTADDFLAASVDELTNGNYMIVTQFWDNGGAIDAGAATWGDGNAAVVGYLSSLTSVVGSTTNDNVGYGRILSNGNYVLASADWDNMGVVDAGASTWIDGTVGLTGIISAANSLVGTTAGDRVSLYLEPISGGNYVIGSPWWDDGGNTDVGALTFADGSTGITGTIDAVNSFIGPDINGLMVLMGEDLVNNRYLVTIENTQRVFSVSSGAAVSSYDGFSELSASTVTLDPIFITNVLDTGTNVTLQANNDITVTDAVIANNGGGNGGNLTLQAGRSILINDDIVTDNGDLNIFANEDLAAGVVNAQRDAGNAIIAMGAGAMLDAGTGNITIRLDDGAGKTNRGAGNISLRDMAAETITVLNQNTTGDVVLESGTLTANGNGDALILSSLRDFINNSGAGALALGGAGRWLVYSTRPENDLIGALANNFSLYACSYAGSCGVLGAGNGLLYSYDPNAPVNPIDTIMSAIVPPTVLYISQAPFLSEAFQYNNSYQYSLSPGFPLTVSYNSETKKKVYTLSDGWIFIEEQLVKALGLLTNRI